jgi:hypothetical protein
MVAGEGIDPEIANEQRGKKIKAQNSQDGASVPMGDHSGQNGPCPLKRI